MKNKKYLPAFLLSALLLTVSTPGFAAWTVKNGRLIDNEKDATLSAREHYEIAAEAFNACDYKTASSNFYILAKCFPLSPFSADANYYLGASLYHLEEFDLANNAFSEYISAKSHPKYFIEAIEFKFCIAENFKAGANRRIMGTKLLPKWASGYDLGVTIFDEVIAALPTHELSAKALYSKAGLLLQMKDYRGSIEALQLVTKRFAKNELAPESYLMITKIYYEQCKSEFQNPDLLAFAEINVRRFKEQFPRDERVVEAENTVFAIKESYAKGLYETAQFYERVEQIAASAIYYRNTFTQFPETSFAKLAEDRLAYLDANFRVKAPLPCDEKGPVN